MNVQLHQDVIKALKMLRFDDNYDTNKIHLAVKSLRLDPCPRDTALDKVYPIENLHQEGLAVYGYRFKLCNDFRFFFCVSRRKNELYVLDMIRRADDTYNEDSDHYLEIKKKYKSFGCKK